MKLECRELNYKNDNKLKFKFSYLIEKWIEMQSPQIILISIFLYM